MKDFDVCIIGSGAGAGPIAYELSHAGYKVAILEKGKWYTEEDFSKDELSCCRRDVFTPSLEKEFHVTEDQDEDGSWYKESSQVDGVSFWNGNVVGGSSNFMSGYFHRLKPIDFRLRSEFGPIEGANIVDWPITYEDLEPYYTRVEEVIGISGKVVPHTFLEPRSTPQYPFPPLAENIAAKFVDTAAKELGYQPLPVARAILSRPIRGRQSCYYSDYCGSYACNSGAKGSSRAALLNDAIQTGNCHIFPEHIAFRIETSRPNRASTVLFYDASGNLGRIDAKIFVVACQAIESSRLLLLSANTDHPNGLGNRHKQLGKNLVFSAGGSGSASFHFEDYDSQTIAKLQQPGLFMNRALQDWYEINDPAFGVRAKGGTIDFVLEHSNPIRRAHGVKWDGSRLRWGKDLKRALERDFREKLHFGFEIFNDWLPNDNCFISLSNQSDIWRNPVANVRLGYHEHDLRIAEYLLEKAVTVARKMNLHNIDYSVSTSPPPNLLAGGCRFGTDPQTSYLDPECRSHFVENLFVSDGSFMPTGGSVPYTWTIYANSFRVAKSIVSQL